MAATCNYSRLRENFLRTKLFCSLSKPGLKGIEASKKI